MFLSQAIDTVKGGGLITFCQSGVIKNCVNEVIHGATKSHDRLTDVDQLTCVLAQDMDTKQFMSLKMEDQFEQANAIADDLSACDLAVVGFSHFIRNTLMREVFFCPSHH